MGYLDFEGLKHLIQNKLLPLINGKSDNGHTHDDRYYTETETDTKLNGKFSNKPQNKYNCNTCYDEGVYLIAQGSNCPSSSQYGSLFVMPYRQPTGNTKPDFCTQLYLPNGDDAKPYLQYRTALRDSWNPWVVPTRGNFDIVTSTTAPLSGTSATTITLVVE